MKKRKNLIFIFLFSIFCIFNLSITVSARSGGGHSSGGDIVVAVIAVAVDMVVVSIEAEEVLLEDIMNQENLMLAI